jgi:hypothetical protein
MGGKDIERILMKTVAHDLELNPQIQHGRAINAVAAYLRRTLSVPNIFLKPQISPAFSVDVLAVDHGGGGDIHAVEVKLKLEIESGFSREPESRKSGSSTPTSAEIYDKAVKAFHGQHLPRKAQEFHAELMALPAHYRYLAISEEHRDTLFGYFAPLGLYSPDGIGRIGLITLFQVRDRLPDVQVAITPERFRVDPRKIAAVDKFLRKAKPDMEVRI